MSVLALLLHMLVNRLDSSKCFHQVQPVLCVVQHVYSNLT